MLFIRKKSCVQLFANSSHEQWSKDIEQKYQYYQITSKIPVVEKVAIDLGQKTPQILSAHLIFYYKLYYNIHFNKSVIIFYSADTCM